MGDVLRVFPDLSTEIEEVRDLGDVTVTRVCLRGHGMERDAPGADPWHVAEWHHKKNIRWRIFMSDADAFEAAGPRE